MTPSRHPIRPLLLSRRQAIAGAALGAPVVADKHTLPAILDTLSDGSKRLAEVDLFVSLDRPQISASARFLLSHGYRTPGKGIALYAATAEQADLTVAGRALYEAVLARSSAVAASALTALKALERYWRVRSADGRWFTLISPHESDMFGTLGDGSIRYETTVAQSSSLGTIVTTECQAYLDYCTYFVRQPALWSAGIHLIDDVLHAGYGDTFRQTLMRGAGARFSAEAGFSGTAFVSTRRDRPLINFAGQRAARLEDVSLSGHFVAHRRAARLGSAKWSGPTRASNGRHDIEPEAWIDPSNPSSADSRYAPYAGITIDAYAGSRPAVGYPEPAYPAWLPALRPWGGAAVSSSVEFDGVSITGFVVGLMVGPSNNPLQGDFVQFHRGQIADCKWAVSVGNHQSRNVGVRDSRIANCWVAFANNAHGLQAGRFGGSIDNVAFGEVINVFDFNQYAGTVQFTACYGESIWRLGWHTSANGFNTGATFSRCTWSFLSSNPARGTAASLLDDRLHPVTGASGTADFPGTLLVVGSVAVLRKRVGSGSVLVQPEERANGVPEERGAWRRDAANALHGGLAIARLDARGQQIDVETLMLDLDKGAPAMAQHNGSPAPRRVGSSIYIERLGTTLSETVARPRTPYFLAKSLILPGSVSFSGKQLTLTLGRALDPYEDGTLRGMGPGGVWMEGDTGTILFCRTADYGNRQLTFEVQNNLRVSRGQLRLIDPISWYSGGDVSIVHGRYYTPVHPLIGDMAKGNTHISNIRPAADNGSMPLDQIRAGDALFLQSDGGIAHAGQITRVHQEPRGPYRLELDRPATATTVRAPLPLFVRAQARNGCC